MAQSDSIPPSAEELARLQEWLERAQVPSSALRAARAAVEEALCRVQAGQAIGTIDAETIADRAGAGGTGAESARRWVNQQKLPQYFNTWLDRQRSWLAISYPNAEFAIALKENASAGGRGNRKTFSLERVPVRSGADNAARTDGPTEGESHPRLAGDAIGTSVQYEMIFCAPEAMTFWGRLIFGSGAVQRKSWRWWLLVIQLFVVVAAAALLVAASVVLPLIGIGQWRINLAASAVVLAALVYLFDIRPWSRIVEDRIRMAGDSLIKDVKPTQLEIWRDGSKSEWRLVRYTGVCPICSSSLEVLPGAPDFPRRLVGRCSESPREHVYSFDRITRRGHVLISPYMPPTHSK